jgi:hypothetical protein
MVRSTGPQKEVTDDDKALRTLLDETARIGSSSQWERPDLRRRFWLDLRRRLTHHRTTMQQRRAPTFTLLRIAGGRAPAGEPSRPIVWPTPVDAR